jgi:hypothetical protein
MPCKACKSSNLRELPAEIAIHFRGMANLDTPAVFGYPTLLICLDCGFTEAVLEAAELWQIRGSDSAAA